MKSKKDTAISSSPAKLYMVATPIGNLGDISARAVEVLETVEWVACEDTRQGKKLFSALQLKLPGQFFSLHAHSGESAYERIIERILGGKSGAYISDAGTPGVSDPGAQLVRLARESGVLVVPIPGASAVTTILSVLDQQDTLPACFHGFYPRLRKEVEPLLSKLSTINGTHIFFESPKRICKTLESLHENLVFRNLQITLGRELTKLHEEILVGTAKELHSKLSSRAVIKGEFVFAISQNFRPVEPEDASAETISGICQDLREYGVPLDQKLVMAIAKRFGWKRNQAYEFSLKLLNKL